MDLFVRTLESTLPTSRETGSHCSRKIQTRIQRIAGVSPGVIISDTFGRAWRNGHTNVAIGVAGIPAFIDYRGTTDSFGTVLKVTTIAVVDEIAAAAELVMGKSANV